MAAPSMVTRSGNNLIVRSVVSGDPLFGTEVKEDQDDFNYYDLTDSEAEPELQEAEEEDDELPQCKVKRNYSCPQCDYYTQNPRFYLYHQKQVHNQKIKIYECDHCLYASKHSQKLQRHVHMVHVMGKKKMEKIKIKVNKSNKNQPDKTETEAIGQTEENIEEETEPVYDETGAQIFKCSVCDMKSKNRVMVARHERLAHLKKKFYRCSKCNYVTHMKARYTKHVKYHSMPMIKCDLCDFRTPYKWNLDRHNKNHTGDGPFKCSICNFTAEIKQSLTVHEMNHHVPPVGHLIVNSNNNNNRRRLKVGASDTMGLVTEEDQIEQSELELLRLERESSYEQNPAEFVQAQLNILPVEPEAAVPSSAASSGSAQRPEQDSPRPQLIQIHKYSCKACDFKGNLGEVQRHEQEKHQIVGIFPEKKKRPIPNLIPIQAQKSLIRPSELTKENVSKLHDNEPFKDLVTLVSIDSPSKETESNKGYNFMDQDKKIDSFRKKNASFFDKLKEKLMTSSNIEGTLTCTFCGHEAKCLSEHMKHQKSHIPGERDDESESSFGSFGVPAIESSSTRCQHCRHRCKTSADLVLHLQMCREAATFRQNDDIPEETLTRDYTSTTEPHPMENKVFIWNDLSENAPLMSSEVAYADSKSSASKHSPPASPSKVTSEKVFVGIEVKPGYGTTTNNGQEEPITSKDVNTKKVSLPNKIICPASIRKVFKCPHCSFWASTASRFHVHIVGHLNKRPFQCSLCHYSSNWRWDITKHIRLKTIRDPTHEKARVLLTDETGRRNYSKYNKYLTTMKMENQQTAKLPRRILPKDGAQQPRAQQQSLNQSSVGAKRPAIATDDDDSSPKKKPHTENKKTMWKCKKCYFRDSDREVVLEHVRDHYRNASEAAKKKKKNFSKSTTLKKEEENSNDPEKSETDIICPAFMCETCPYTSETWSELEGHSEKHFVCTVNGKQLKCQFCSFYAQDNEELSVHSLIHGDAPANDLDKSTALICSLCPYVASNRTQLVYHQGRHNQDDSPHKCYKCSYVAPNNTILALHVRLHGRHTASDNNDVKSTNVTSHSAADIGNDDSASVQNQMVWVVKSRGLVKMFKCRYCLLVNSRKNVVLDHEKMHSDDSTSSVVQLQCLDCNFVCNNGSVLAAHCKAHQSIYNQIVGIFDSTKSDEEQINQVKESVNRGEIDGLVLNGEVEKSPLQMEKEAVERVLRFCNLCPARFLFAKEMKIHMRFHELNLLFKCDSCTYTARQKQHLEAHFKVHTDEYQERTNVLTGVYGTDSTNPRPKITSVANEKSDSVWIVFSDKKEEEPVKPKEKPAESIHRPHGPSKQFTCSKCPAEFFKSVALSYHETLHGGPGPHKCKYCDYAVKTYGNLIRHEAVHKNELSKGKTKTEVDLRHKRETSPVKSLTKSPPSTPLTIDPEFGMLIHGSPDFVYPTYLRNGKPKEKRYKCHKCPSAFEKRDQYKIHLSLHGSRQRYRCDRCDYSVKYYANFTQHIKKHDSYDMTSKGKKNDDDVSVGGDGEVNRMRTSIDGNKSLKYSTADEQAFMMMQQKSVANLTLFDKDALSRCPHCPYTNMRRDGVSGHIRCHSNPKGGPYVCKFCDYTVPQSHFLREHAKIHFNPPKFFKPDAYMKVDRLEIWAEPVDAVSSDEKFLVFKDQGDKIKNDRFLPKIDNTSFDNGKGRVYVNLRTGEEEAEVDDEIESNKSNFNVKSNGELTNVNEDSTEYLPKSEPVEDPVEKMDEGIEEAVESCGNEVTPINGGTEYSKSSCSSDSDCSDLSAQDNNNGKTLTNPTSEEH